MPSLGPLPFAGGALRLTQSLDGSGNGSIMAGPQRVREHWQVDAVYVEVTSNVLEATCKVAVGSPGGLQNFGTTVTGSSGDTCSVGKDIQPGQVVTATWKGGDPNATGIMTIFGTYTIGAP